MLVRRIVFEYLENTVYSVENTRLQYYRYWYVEE